MKAQDRFERRVAVAWVATLVVCTLGIFGRDLLTGNVMPLVTFFAAFIPFVIGCACYGIYLAIRALRDRIAPRDRR